MAFAVRLTDQSRARKRAGGSSAGMRSALLNAVRRTESEQPWTEAADVRDVWDLSQRETSDRVRVALDGVWRAYVSIPRVEALPQWQDSIFRAAYERVSRELDVWEASR